MTHFLFYNHDVTQSECAHRLLQDIQMLWYDWCEIHALMRQSDWCEIQTLMRLSDWCEIHTLMPRSDWCEQHTTLYANIEFFFLWKEKTQKSISSQTKWSLLYWPCRRRLSDVLAMAIRMKTDFSKTLICLSLRLSLFIRYSGSSTINNIPPPLKKKKNDNNSMEWTHTHKNEIAWNGLFNNMK